MPTPRMRAALAGAALIALPAAGFAAPVSSFVALDSATSVHGAVSPGTVVHFQVVLRLRDAAGLAALNTRHARLGAAEFAAHMPDAASLASVAAFLRGHGLTIEAAPASGLAFHVAGPASLVGRVLGVKFIAVSREGADYVSADREPVVPAAIAPYVLGIVGLQPQYHAYPMIRFGGDADIVPLAAGGKPPLYPSDLLTAYSANGLGSGAGTTTAIIINTFPYTADLTRFWSTTGVAQSLSNITFIQSVAGTLPKPGGEESLDVEQSSSMAPASKVRVYATVDLSNAHIDTGFQNVIADLQAGVKITQVSISLGGCETSTSAAQKTADDQYFATMTALGASVFVSSGDSGAHECARVQGTFTGPITPSFFSTSPNVTAVGGTTLTLNSNSTIKTETSWSSSGGGISKFFATPSWQQGLGYAMRAVPDVSADANPNTGVYVIYAGKTGQVGGTSVSSPVWAGLMGLVNADRINGGKPTLGLVASRTTSLVRTSNFRDITSGSNHGYSAKVGYDLVTGVGTPVMSNLLATLLSQN
jgi:kumamolisin